MAATDKDCADLMMGLYAYPGVPAVTWDHLDSGADDGICWSAKIVGDVPVICLRGSVTVEDWLRDFDCVANPFNPGALGPVHPGFYLGLDRVLSEMMARGMVTAAAPPIITGHSLGAGRACILTGMMVAAKMIPARRVCFGEPMPGFAQLGKLIAAVPAASYCAGDDYGHDLVTEVPFALALESYTHPCALTHLGVTPQPGDRWGFLSYHHMAGYQAALA